jgi:hypothetical protein
VAQDFNGDVDRPMAAFAESRVPRGNFPAVPSAASAIPADEAAVRTSRAAAFPLLMAALPEIGQFALPDKPDTGSAKSGVPVVERSPTRRPRTLDRPMAQPPEPTPRPPNLSAVFGVPLRHVPAAHTPPEPARGWRPAGSSTTPIAAMFHALHAASPSPDAPAETKTGLQAILNRL